MGGCDGGESVVSAKQNAQQTILGAAKLVLDSPLPLLAVQNCSHRGELAALQCRVLRMEESLLC